MSDNVDTFSSVFLEGLHQLHLSLSTQQQEQLLRYRQELLDWNTRVNLTAIKDPDEVLIKHFLDSLSLLSVYDSPETKLLDIGSGAGFPGLVLKIVRPQWHITSLEATGKKSNLPKAHYRPLTSQWYRDHPRTRRRISSKLCVSCLLRCCNCSRSRLTTRSPRILRSLLSCWWNNHPAQKRRAGRRASSRQTCGNPSRCNIESRCSCNPIGA